MNKKWKVGIAGATGMVGQNYVRLLAGHPWFDLCYVAASSRSAGKTYREAVAGKWHMSEDIPRAIADLPVRDAADVAAAARECQIIFSAVSMDKSEVRELESAYARSGLAVVSNNSAHRWTGEVPILIPEVNPGHLAVLEEQRRRYGFGSGCIVVKPNCSIQSYLLPLHALNQAGYRVSRALVTTMQSMSGAGYPGPAGLDMVDNMIPFIAGEDEKSEREPGKVFGSVTDGRIVPDESLVISAQCNRVPVVDGHMASVSIGFAGTVPEADEILSIWRGFVPASAALRLPSAPEPAIVYRDESDRPQPKKDRQAGRGMAITLGRLRRCAVLDYRFVGLSHNTVRGAAGGAVLMAELLVAEGCLG